jgi:hypothetical protein
MKGLSGTTWVLGLSLAVAFAAPGLAGARQDERPGRRAHTSPALEVEPGPPLSLSVQLVNLQKNVSGGVASVDLGALAAVDLKEVTVTVTLPQDVTFADGSHVYTQTLNLAAGATFDLPKDLLVGKDGKYNIALDASGTTSQGKPVHRGFSYKLLVGTQEKLPPVKDGAIEYQGVPGGGN